MVCARPAAAAPARRPGTGRWAWWHGCSALPAALQQDGSAPAHRASGLGLRRPLCRYGSYKGYCALGVLCQNLENPHLRAALKMRQPTTGVLINTIQATTATAQVRGGGWLGQAPVLLLGARRGGKLASAALCCPVLQQSAGAAAWRTAGCCPRPCSLLHAPSPACAQVLRKNDVLLEFAGVTIANDGTVHFRHRERIYFSYLITLTPTGERAGAAMAAASRQRQAAGSSSWQQAQLPCSQRDGPLDQPATQQGGAHNCGGRVMPPAGGSARVKVLRDGEVMEFDTILQPVESLVPVHQYDKLPSYFIYAGQPGARGWRWWGMRGRG
jgi:hypothetical protein